MRGRWIMAAAAGAAICMAVPAEALAQGNSANARARQAQGAQQREVRERERDQNRDRERQRAVNERDRQRDGERIRAEQQRQRELERQREWERQRERERQREWERQRRYGYDQGRAGPAFCRDGSGHPVFGRQWCRSKGFGLGNSRGVWERARWDDVIFRQPRRYDDRMGRSVLADILGERVLRRYESWGHQQYGRGDIRGQWYDDPDVAVLELTVGGVPFARLVDTNRSGRYNTYLLRR